MANRNVYDAAIIGASIAGSAAAIFFARKGAKVALIERDANPAAYKKVCTHYILASATPAIERLGLASKIEEAGGLRNDVDFHTRWGCIRAPRRQTIERPAYGYSIRLEKLDPMLRRMAAETPGVDFIPGFSAQELLVSRNRICGAAIYGAGGATRQIEARLTVGADGRNSRVAELAGLAVKEKPQGRIFYFAHYRDLAQKSGNRAQMWSLEPDIAYTFPNDDGVTLVTAMPARAKLAEWKSDPEAAMKRLFANLPEGPNLEKAKRITPFFGVIEYPNWTRKPGRPGLALIGDAAMSIDPLWGVGCGWAFQTAEWLADAAGLSCQSADDAQLDRDLGAYARLHRKKLAGHKSLICDYSTARPYNFIEKLMFSAATRDPICADLFSAFGTRCIGVSQFLSPKALTRAAWVNIRHALGTASTKPAPAPAE
jgi:flavin-dependent dehydrogenase